MKNTNNITLIVFIIIVVGVISTATFFIYRNNTKKEANQTNAVQECSNSRQFKNGNCRI